MTMRTGLEQARLPEKPFASSMNALPHRFRPSVGARLRARVHVATTGPEPGNWLIAIDGEQCRIFTGSIPSPDARVYTDSEIGQTILEGGQSLRSAIESRLLDYDGDIESLRSVAACLGLENES